MRKILLLAVILLPISRADTFLGPTPYLSFADSPFNGGSFSYFYLETFEDHLSNTPGVTGSPGGVTSVVFGPSIHDSVDADDGVIDGSGLNGDSYFSSSGAGGVTFYKNIRCGLSPICSAAGQHARASRRPRKG
jgi:hypothetical protein